MTIHVHFDGKVLVPVEPLNLPKDRLLEVDIRQATNEKAVGTAAAVLLAMKDEPHIRGEDVDEMLAMIKDSQSPSRKSALFDDLAE